ncbi:MAG: DUF4445 domain-containing protein [Firmicutes bacterium]|nr:DUF4445 domain-containing protein [Bacillota bacterium]
MSKYQVHFSNLGLKVPVEKGTSLLTAAWLAGVNLRSECNGKGICGKCRVLIHEFKDTGHKSSNHKFFVEEELRQGWRLACEIEIDCDLKVTVPKASRDMGAVIRKSYTHREIELKPFVRRFYLDLPPFEAHHGTGMWEQCAAILRHKYKMEEPVISPTAMIRLSNLAGRNVPPLEAFVSQNQQVICIRRKKDRPMLGLAVDIGTTSLAAYLGDLDNNRILAADSVLNPQVVYGGDVLSRISLIQERPEMLAFLQQSVLQAVNGLIVNMTESVGANPDDIVDVTVVGNTTMHHLFLGLNPEALGKYPFIPTIKTAQYVRSSLLGLNVNPGAHIYMFPVFSAYVGADTIGVRIAEQFHEQEIMKLIMDIGTNGELVLGSNNRSFCTSVATGPAFEGAQIKFGMRAAPGAIEKLSIDPKTLDVEYTVIPSPGEKETNTRRPVGICGSGIFSAVAELLKAGIIMENGAFDKSKKHARIRQEKGSKKYEFVLAFSEQSGLDADITICQDDVRAVQLGKSALLAGAQILMQHAGIEEPDEIILAGAFGSYIDIDDAITIGLVPHCPRGKIYAVGNAAGDGARMALFNWDFREKAQRFEEETEFIALSGTDKFQDVLVKAMKFPRYAYL